MVFIQYIMCIFVKENKVKIQLSCVLFLFQWMFQSTFFGNKKKTIYIPRKNSYTKHYWKFYYGLVLLSLRVKSKNALMGHLELYRKLFFGVLFACF